MIKGMMAIATITVKNFQRMARFICGRRNHDMANRMPQSSLLIQGDVIILAYGWLRQCLGAELPLGDLAGIGQQFGE